VQCHGPREIAVRIRTTRRVSGLSQSRIQESEGRLSRNRCSNSNRAPRVSTEPVAHSRKVRVASREIAVRIRTARRVSGLSQSRIQESEGRLSRNRCSNSNRASRVRSLNPLARNRCSNSNHWSRVGILDPLARNRCSNSNHWSRVGMLGPLARNRCSNSNRGSRVSSAILWRGISVRVRTARCVSGSSVLSCGISVRIRTMGRASGTRSFRAESLFEFEPWVARQ